MTKTGPKPKPPFERVLARVRYEGECWVFTGSLRQGHGQVQVGSLTDGSRQPRAAHRVVYEALVGPIPEGYDLHHECRVRACVNPAHCTPLSKSEHGAIHTKEATRRKGKRSAA